MVGCRCSYKNCQNTTKTTENIHFFHYPVKYKERCRTWIKNANKPQFCDLNEDQLRNKVICEYHFEDKWFVNSQKKRLIQGAIPTLDGDFNKLSDRDMYISNGIEKIQILPASSDGSLFILDTDSIPSHGVESFVYKNGMILPSSSTLQPSLKPEIIKPKLPVSKPSTSKVINPIINTIRPDVTPECDFPTKMFSKNDYETSNEHQDVDKKLNVVKNSKVTKPSLKKVINKNYLRKIMQHSRDIACIKKMLKEKTATPPKLDADVVIAYLKEELPPTLFTTVNLHISSKCELNEGDEEFFTDIHKLSPEVYQTLIEKYKWNLPTIDEQLE